MKLLDVKELAKLTNTSEAFWRKVVFERQIPIVKVGRLVRINPSDVEAFLAARTRPAKVGGE